MLFSTKRQKKIFEELQIPIQNARAFIDISRSRLDKELNKLPPAVSKFTKLNLYLVLNRSAS